MIRERVPGRAISMEALGKSIRQRAETAANDMKKSISSAPDVVAKSISHKTSVLVDRADQFAGAPLSLPARSRLAPAAIHERCLSQSVNLV